MIVTYLTYHEIDKSKWDQLIIDSPNGFIYSHSFFLDSLCQWNALIMDDYQYVMPLPFKKKAGFNYIYTPFFIGQLGITGKDVVSEIIYKKFIQSIPATFSFVDLQLNEFNAVAEMQHLQKEERINYVLPLNKDYDTIAANFNKDAKKNLRQAAKFELSVADNVSLDIVFDLYKKAYGNLNKRITKNDYANFYKTCSNALNLKRGFITGIKNVRQEIVAAAFFAKDNKRIYYLLGAPSAEGKKVNATHLLINEVIKQYAGSELEFDFEGSDIPSVANFYRKFGPLKKTYQHISINRLPFYIKWLKKR